MSGAWGGGVRLGGWGGGGGGGGGVFVFFFFFNDTATTEIYTLSLHDALPISDYCNPSAISISGMDRSKTAMKVQLIIGEISLDAYVNITKYSKVY